MSKWNPALVTGTWPRTAFFSCPHLMDCLQNVSLAFLPCQRDYTDQNLPFLWRLKAAIHIPSSSPAHGSCFRGCWGGLFVPSLTVLPSPALPRGQPTPPVLGSRCLYYRRTEGAWRWGNKAFPLAILLFHLCVSGGLCLFRDDPYGPVFQPNTILFSNYDCFWFTDFLIYCYFFWFTRMLFSLFSKTVIFSLREFLNTDITGSEDLASVKAFESRCVAKCLPQRPAQLSLALPCLFSSWLTGRLSSVSGF